MSLKHAILGFLNLDPMSGYTLRKRFEGSVASYWSVTQSQIYRELRALENDKLVSQVTVPGQGKPAQLVYSLTPAGAQALSDWLNEPVGPQQIRHPLLLKLSFLGRGDPAIVSRLLDNYAKELKAIEADYAERLEATRIFSLSASPREALLWRLLIENGLSWVSSERNWAQSALKKWSTQT